MDNTLDTDLFFSIIVPVYNAEKYLKECIESVLRQSYPNFELILVNDGSSDKSGTICDRYALLDNRVRVVHQKNRGELISRLIAVDNSKGDYVASLDADDYYDIHLLERIKQIIDRYHCDAVFFDLGQELYINTDNYNDIIAYNKYDALKRMIETTNHSLCTKVIKKSAVMKGSQEIPRNLKLKINADYIHMVSILKYIDCAIEIKDVLYYYRDVPSSASRAFCAQDIKDIIYTTDYVIKELTGRDIYDDEMQKSIFTSMLKMMSFRLIALFDVTTSKEDISGIYNNPIYIRSKKFEKKKYFALYHFLLLKMFRWKQKWFFHLIRKKNGY